MKKETVRSWVILISLAILLVAGLLITGSFAFKAALIFLAALVLISGIMAYVSSKELEIWVTAPATMEKGEEHTGKIVIKNKGYVPALNIKGEIKAINQLTGEEALKTFKTKGVSRGITETDISFSSVRCGYIRLSPGNMYSCDWFGIFRFPVRGKMQEKTISVLPETFVPDIHIQVPAVFADDADVWSQVKKGNDITEIFALREYVPGDKLSTIHWKLSGKRNELIVKEPSLPVEKSVLLFWDKNSGDGGPDGADAMAEVVSSVAQRLSEEEVLFTFGWTEGSTMSMEEIEYKDDLLDAIPRMIKTGKDKDGDPGWRMLKDSGKYGHFSKVVYFSSDITEFEPFCGGQNIFLICGDMGPGDDIAGRTYFYAPGDYKEVLKDIEL